MLYVLYMHLWDVYKDATTAYLRMTETFRSRMEGEMFDLLKY